MFLAIRMIAYFAFAFIAGQADWAAFDQTTGLLTIDTDTLSSVLSGGAGVAGFIGTFALSRLAKARGGKT